MPSLSPQPPHPPAEAHQEAPRTDFLFIQLVSRIVLAILMRFWALSSATLFAILLLYWLYGGWLAFCLLCFAVSGMFYHVGDWLLYHPDQPNNSRLYVPSPKLFGLPYENLYISTKDGVRINIVLIKQAFHFNKVPTLVFFHGNAGNVGHRLLNARGLYNLGMNILLVEYRGYGLSDGIPSEEGLYLDAYAALDFLLSRPDINHYTFVMFGRSLGGAVAVRVASHPDYRKHIVALVLENTFTCIPDAASILFNFWIIRLLPYWCHKNQFNTRHMLKQLRIPTLFISGLADNLIPARMMMELYQTSGSPIKKIARFESGTHNDTWQCENYYETISKFLSEVLLIQQENQQPFSDVKVSIQVPPEII